MGLLVGSKTLSRLLEEADVSVRLNQMTGEGEWTEGATRNDPLSPLWEKITKYPGNVLLGHVRLQAAPRCLAWQWRMSLRRLLGARVVNPFQEWLATLPSWDGEPRLDLLLDRALDVDPDCDPGLAAWAGRHYVMGAIARQCHGRGGDYAAVGEGARSHVPLLAGPRFTLYRGFAAALLPSEPFAKEWTHGLWGTWLGGDSVDVQGVMRNTQGRVFATVDDLLDQPRDILRWAADSFARLHDRPSNHFDRHSLRYRTAQSGGRRRGIDYRRRAVLVVGASEGFDKLATIPNLNSCLVSIPVRRKRVEFDDVIDSGYRDQLWAEGLSRLGNGESFRFPEELAPAAQDSNAMLIGPLSRYLPQAAAVH